jgi:hypothetical protein
MTQISSGFESASSCMGGLEEYSPSQYAPVPTVGRWPPCRELGYTALPVCTALNSEGIAAEARTASTLMPSLGLRLKTIGPLLPFSGSGLWLLKTWNSPVLGLAAPMYSTGTDPPRAVLSSACFTRSSIFSLFTFCSIMTLNCSCQ